MHSSPYILGVTGGIGSGKSVVSYLLRLMGVPVYDCDREAKRLMCESVDIREALIKVAGAEVYDAAGRLNRAYLASFMFGDAKRVAMVNGIVHPVVRADFKAWAGQARKAVVAVESAILFEAGMDAYVDAVWLVHAEEDIRLQRAMRRDGACEKAVRSRMQNQLTEQEYVERADAVICNDGKRSLIGQLLSLLAHLMDEEVEE